MDSAFVIVPYSEAYKDDFRKLNEEWIRKFFKIEEMDRITLHHPKESILDKGDILL
nr:hypothetical protein [uncultured Allomuricauda sp.]